MLHSNKNEKRNSLIDKIQKSNAKKEGFKENEPRGSYSAREVLANKMPRPLVRKVSEKEIMI